MVGEQSVSMLCGDPGRHRNTFFSLGRRISFFAPTLGGFACSSCAKPDYSNRSLCFSFFPNGGQLPVLRRRQNFQMSQILLLPSEKTSGRYAGQAWAAVCCMWPPTLCKVCTLRPGVQVCCSQTDQKLVIISSGRDQQTGNCKVHTASLPRH